MWELTRLTSRGGNSTRRIFTYGLATFMVAFLWTILLSPITHAADASWSGDSISYDNNTYYGPAKDETVSALSLPTKTTVYTSIDPKKTASESNPVVSRYIHVIYFAPDVDTNIATSAKYKTYIYQGPDSYTDPTFPIDIAIPARSTAPNPGTSSCVVGDGMGWLICPITNFLASGMDWIFNVLSGFLVVQPVQTGQDNALYRAWSYMRSFANVAFVIAFLIIIYSQLTNVGINNYSIKKLLPRLIIAALLVNVSYLICSIAVDVSNVLGYSIQELFIQMRNSLVGTEGNSWDVTSWQSISGFILSGGTAVAAGSIGLVTTVSAFGVGGSIILLLPALVTGLVAVLVALLVMATRQAIITILIVIAPLAFVAYLLPNTEKWFGRWRELFTTMLVLFPAFSVVFGGSQLAAAAIIQNADSINLIILGMMVQVAPLFITPMLIRLSGSLLGKVAGLVNNPNKGIIDRTRKFAEDRAGNIKARRLGETAKPHQIMRRTGQALDNRRRTREGYRKLHENMADNNFADTETNRELHLKSHRVETAKETIDNKLKLHIQDEINITGSELHVDNVRLENSKLQLDEAIKQTTADIEEYKSGRRVATGELASLMTSMKDGVANSAAQTQRTQSAEYIQQRNISTSFTDTSVAADALLKIAAGVDLNGLIRAKANAGATLAKLEKEALDNSVQLLNIEAMAKKTTLKMHAINEIEREINAKGSVETQLLEAALEAVANDGQVSLLRKARMSTNIDQSVLTKLFARNASTLKAKGAYDLQDDPSLAGVSQQVMNASIAKTIGDVSASNLSEVKAGFWGDISNDIGTIIVDSKSIHDTKKRQAATDGLRKTYITVTEALRNDDIRATLGDRLNETIAIHQALQNEYGDKDKTIDYSKLR